MKHLILMLVAICLLTACASKRVHLPLRPISEPPINQQYTTNLGERMLMQAVGYYTDILRVRTLDVFGVYIAGGDFCRIPGTNNFISFDGRAVGLKNAFGMIIDHTNQLEYDAVDNEVCAEGTFTLCYDQSEVQFNVENNRLCSDPSAFQQIIEYNGMAGDVLNFTYRELTRGRMHASFTTNFSMDISKGSEVTYKGAKLEVIEASNQSITYRIIQNFNQASI